MDVHIPKGRYFKRFGVRFIGASPSNNLLSTLEKHLKVASRRIPSDFLAKLTYFDAPGGMKASLQGQYKGEEYCYDLRCSRPEMFIPVMLREIKAVVNKSGLKSCIIDPKICSTGLPQHF